jgi:hypothetical protein
MSGATEMRGFRLAFGPVSFPLPASRSRSVGPALARVALTFRGGRSAGRFGEVRSGHPAVVRIGGRVVLAQGVGALVPVVTELAAFGWFLAVLAEDGPGLSVFHLAHFL